MTYTIDTNKNCFLGLNAIHQLLGNFLDTGTLKGEPVTSLKEASIAFGLSTAIINKAYKEMEIEGYVEKEKKEYRTTNLWRKAYYEEDTEEANIPKLTREVVKFLNEKTGQDFNPESVQYRKLIKAIMLADKETKNGASHYDTKLLQFQAIIDVRWRDWKDDESQRPYVTITNLFNSPAKFLKHLDYARAKFRAKAG